MKINKFKYSLMIAAVTVGLFVFMHLFLNISLERLFYGIPRKNVFLDNHINMQELFQWIWIYFPLWFIGGYYIEEYFRLKSLVMLRYPNMTTWFRVLCRDCLFMVASYFVVLFAGCLICLPVTTLWPSLLITVHGEFFLAVFIFIRCLTDSAVAATMVVLFAEVMGLLSEMEFGLPYMISPSVWGMYIRSDIFGVNRSFVTFFVILVQSLGSVALMGITCKCVRKLRR